MNDAFVTDVSWRRPRDRRLLIAGSPLTLLRFSEAAVADLDALECGRPPANDELCRHLLARGAVHRVDPDPAATDELTVVVPARVESPDDRRRLLALAETLAPLTTVIVDDDSPTEFAVPPGCSDSTTIIRHDIRRGPAAARNTGLAAVRTPYVVFVDSDATVTAEVLRTLVAHLRDPTVALAAPRVISGRRRGLLARYEVTASPLDMGRHPCSVRPGARVGYLPATVLAARVSSLRDLGGFDPAMRFGEDVDLVWRLHDRGLRSLHVASLSALHEPRATPWALARQRFGYGTSAAVLARAHRAHYAPFRGHLLVSLGWLAAALAAWSVAGALLATAAILGTFRLRRHGVDVRTAGTVVIAGQVGTARHLARASTREWLPFAIAGSILDSRVAIAMAVAWVVPATGDIIRGWRERPSTRCDPLTFLALRVVDYCAYSAGVWWGVIRRQSPTAIVPSLRLAF